MIKTNEEAEVCAIRKFINTLYFEGIVLSRFDKELNTYLPVSRSTAELYQEYISGK